MNSERITGPGWRAARENGRAWIGERPNLRPRTVGLYGYLLRAHLVPTFGEKALNEIKDPQVRRWRKKPLDAGSVR